MKILIVGGGVAGPALARFLKDSAEITLVDKAPAFGNIGYAITLWGNGEKILKSLGINQSVLKEGYEIPWTTSENKKGKLLEFFSLSIFRKYGPLTTVTRTALQQALVKDLEKSINIRLGTTISSISQEENAAVVGFSDGSIEKFDLVVGADGIRSVVREIVFGKNFLKYYGWKVYAFWIPKEFVPPIGAIDFLSNGKICFIYPMEDKAVVMLSIASGNQVFTPEEMSKDYLHKTFADFKDLIVRMIDDMENPDHIFHDNLAHVDMNDWYKGRVVLMGDAQHATSPLTGMGASMALEDAYVLAEELKRGDMEDVDLALSRYSKRRGLRIKRFRRASKKIEDWMMIRSPFLRVVRDMVLEILPTSYFTKPIESVLMEEI